MSDTRTVHVWQRPDRNPSNAAYFYMEEGRSHQKYPQSQYSVRQFAEALDSYWDGRYSQGGWLMDVVHGPPVGYEGVPLNSEQQKELKRVLGEQS